MEIRPDIAPLPIVIGSGTNGCTKVRGIAEKVAEIRPRLLKDKPLSEETGMDALRSAPPPPAQDTCNESSFNISLPTDPLPEYFVMRAPRYSMESPLKTKVPEGRARGPATFRSKTARPALSSSLLTVNQLLTA